jgi:hypothetical protein
MFWNGSTAIEGLSGRGSEYGKNGSVSRGGVSSDPVCLDRLSDILHLLVAEIDEGNGQLGADLILHGTRDANRARLRKSLQAGRNIDGIAKKIVALHDDIADMDADAETHLLGGRSIRILLCDRLLNLDGTLHGVHSTGEVRDQAVARRIEDPTPMRGYQPIRDDPVCGEGAERADLIEAHQAAVAFDIGGEDRSELSFDRVRFQGSAPPRSNIARLSARSEGFSAHSGSRW